VNNPHDRGGATNEGITQATYNAFRKAEGLKAQSVKNISSAEIDSIYRSIWRQSGADELPWPLSLVQFDTAIESPTLAKTLLARVEGKYQSPTEAAAAYVRLRMQWRLDDVKDDPTQSVFLNGWQDRDNALLAHVSQAVEGPVDVSGGSK
jgi:lysozyme family protein